MKTVKSKKNLLRALMAAGIAKPSQCRLYLIGAYAYNYNIDKKLPMFITKQSPVLAILPPYALNRGNRGAIEWALEFPIVTIGNDESWCLYCPAGVIFSPGAFSDDA
jgi:hypothetical protein